MQTQDALDYVDPQIDTLALDDGGGHLTHETTAVAPGHSDELRGRHDPRGSGVRSARMTANRIKHAGDGNAGTIEQVQV